MEDKINSSESEGVFAEFIEERLSDMVVDALNKGKTSDLGQGGGDFVVKRRTTAGRGHPSRC
jgi:hypothetical protein